MAYVYVCGCCEKEGGSRRCRANHESDGERSEKDASDDGEDDAVTEIAKATRFAEQPPEK